MKPELPEKPLWDSFNRDKNPFRSYEFMSALKNSSSIGAEAGWLPFHAKLSDDSFLYTFLKNHSYGEFIFDWGWAEAYERAGIPYYPKLTSMIPFTPVNTTPFMMSEDSDEKKNSLLKAHDEILEQSEVSGAHFLFIQNRELNLFNDNNYLTRESLQYHFINENFLNFEQFLSRLKTKKGKNIQKERQFQDLHFVRKTGPELSEAEADRMYGYYSSTIENKFSYAYLKKDFFRLIFKTMPQQVLFIEAFRNESPVAGSLFFYDTKNLYGRYWGAHEFIPNLHFELCYYQGLDFLFENKLEIFEAGAQGEHKISRGFTPTIILSAHKLKHPAFHTAVADFIEREKKVIRKNQEDLRKLMPFKS